jgi:hypothetical protein
MLSYCYAWETGHAYFSSRSPMPASGSPAPEHPGTLTTRSNLASSTGQAGDPAAARDQYAALLPVREQVLGTEHPETLTARANLGYWEQQAEG